MPAQGTPERVTLWATGGRVLMRLQIVPGRGRARFRRAAYGCLRSSKSLRYSLGNVRSPAEVAVPRLHLDVVFAATEPDIQERLS